MNSGAGWSSIYEKLPDAKQLKKLRYNAGALLNWTDSGSVVSIVNHPFWHQVATVIPNSRFVYDCMDFHEGFSNTGGSIIAQEKQMIEDADVVITSSFALYDSVKDVATQSILLRNAADYQHFCDRPQEVYEDPEGRKIIGYYGAIAEWFDIELVAKIAQRFSDCLILLIGEDTVCAGSRLGTFANVECTGEVPYDKLPFYLHSFHVCMLPFRITPLTKATNPVKLYEYLSAGKPVVTVNLPEMTQFEGLIQVSEDDQEFLNHIGSFIHGSNPSDDVDHRKEFARVQTWEHRAHAFIGAVETADQIPLVSIIVVTYNNLALTKDCINSILAHSDYDNIEVIIVDNASTDETVGYLRDLVAGRDNFKLIANETNRGFAAANNQGLSVASGQYLTLLNNDTYVTGGWIQTLVNHLKRNGEIGIIGPVTNNIGNEAKIEIEYSDMEEMAERSSVYIRFHLGDLKEIRTLAFFCVMIPRATFERVGFLDEVFGRGFFEDDDYCRRVEQEGLKIVLAEDVFVHHYLSASFDKIVQSERKELFLKNKAIYEKKWGPWVRHATRKSSWV